MNFMNSFDTVMTDCDGVIWFGLGEVPGVGAALNALEECGKRVVYVSNNSTRPTKDYKKKIEKLGAKFQEENLVHPMVAIIDYLNKTNFKGLIYSFATECANNRLREAGYEVLDGPVGKVEENHEKILKSVNDGAPVRLVIAESDLNFNLAKFWRADIYLKHPECDLIVGAYDRRIPVTQDFDIPGQAPIINCLVGSLPAGKRPIILGKPGVDLGEILMSRYNIKDHKRVLFVGDLICTDIKFASNVGFQSLLVLSGGITRERMLANKDTTAIPNYYADSISDFTTLIRSL
uniref:Putative pyridoxal phosphate phosphatase n=1 Tax=Lutzomyia longipalpis TaxID=7200 RepID=A0A7G3AXI2_LUTLO